MTKLIRFRTFLEDVPSYGEIDRRMALAGTGTTHRSKETRPAFKDNLGVTQRPGETDKSMNDRLQKARDKRHATRQAIAGKFHRSFGT